MILYLLRHGESEANARRMFAVHALDPPLTDAGVAQVTKQAEFSSSAGIVAIHASSLLRTRQTAAIVAERCGLPIAITSALWEVDVGQLDGRSVDEESLSAFRGVIGEWEEGALDARLPEGETLASARDRFGSFLDGLSDGPEGPLLIVGHGVLFMVVLWAFCENPQPRMMDNYMGRGHLSVLSGRDRRYQLVEFNLAPGAAAGVVVAR